MSSCPPISDRFYLRSPRGHAERAPCGGRFFAIEKLCFEVKLRGVWKRRPPAKSIDYIVTRPAPNDTVLAHFFCGAPRQVPPVTSREKARIIRSSFVTLTLLCGTLILSGSSFDLRV
jgi:hypothetical protein